MKLRTSYFNRTVLLKDITRFAPVWGLYTIFLLLFLLLTQVGQNGAEFANHLTYIIPGTSWLNLIYAAICATLLFGDLFNTRMCNALHAMPMRREGWFLTHMTSGLLFAAVPNVLVTLISCVFLQEYFYMGLIWLAVCMLEYLFFFGMAVFSVMCVGNRLAMFVIYGLINTFATLCSWITQLLYMPLLFGLQLDTAPFEWLTPCAQLPMLDYVEADYGKIRGFVWGGFIPEDWVYLYILAAVGVVLLGLALLLYRRRHLEWAGDFITLKPVRVLFLLIYAILAGTLLYALAEAFGIIFFHPILVVGLLIGFFTGKMLLDRTVRVFSRKNWLTFLVLAGAVILTLVVTRLDPLGLTRYIPRTEQIQSAHIYSDSDEYSFTGAMGGPLEYTEEADINYVRTLHQLVLDNRAYADHGRICNITVRYTLKDGTALTRYYKIPNTDALSDAFKELFTSPEYILQTHDWEETVAGLNMIEVNLHNIEEYSHITGLEHSIYHITKPEDIRALMDAVYQDCLEGNMAQGWHYHQEEAVVASFWLGTPVTDDNYWSTGFEINGQVYNSMWFRDLHIYSNCTHTITFLEEHLTSAQTGVSNGATLIPPG